MPSTTVDSTGVRAITSLQRVLTRRLARRRASRRRDRGATARARRATAPRRPSARYGATLPFCITSAYGRPVASMCAMARSSAGPMASASVGNSSHGISIVSSISGVIGPISACCGSSGTPGWPRQVTISSCGRRKVQVSEVSGLTALPSPEFCIIAMPRRPSRRRARRPRSARPHRPHSPSTRSAATDPAARS